MDRNTSILSVDVAIVGGGVAGSSLGAALATAGFGVTIIEREARFRDRIRGEGLHPWGAAKAARLGLVPVLEAAGGQRLPIWQRYQDRQPEEPYRWDEDVEGGHVEWGISHPALQDALLGHAVSCGARVLRPARVTKFRQGDRLELALEGDVTVETIRARLIVGADGANSVVRRWIGATVQRDPVHHMIGGCLLGGVALAADAAHQAYPEHGMSMIFPLGQEKARGYLILDPERAASFRGAGGSDRFLQACAAVYPDGMFVDAQAIGPAGFFPGADRWSDRLTGDRVVLVGDAAGANDPSQGHGLSLAFFDARMLRDLLSSTLIGQWNTAVSAYADTRAAVFSVLRAHAIWTGMLLIDQGLEADERRARAKRARDADPSAGGFTGIHAFGPVGLDADEAAQRHFFGEDLD